MDLQAEVTQVAEDARDAARILATISSAAKDGALLNMADALVSGEETILEANAKDLSSARDKGLSPAMIDRLTLNRERIEGMARGLRDIAALPDPVGEVSRMWKRPNDLQIGRIRVPIGVIGFIYESRPNVTVDAAGLCLKAGNAVILRGGSEAINSNITLADILQSACSASSIPQAAVQLVRTTDRAAVMEILKLDGLIDLIVPRGGPELIRTVKDNTRIPVIGHDKGLCHIYVAEDADQALARKVVLNAKAQRPGVCNALETLLVHGDAAPGFLPRMASDFQAAGVEMRGCPRTREYVPQALEATEEDWDTEYLDLIISIKVVRDLDEAIAHIERYSSGLCEAIITTDYNRAREFLSRVDSSAVFVNASTRFTDGGEFGMGAELGISTQKLHARGPMGIEELTSYKYIVFGQGQIRE
jgi:glutamate-5-semialdehyde dehydrogenase